MSSYPSAGSSEAMQCMDGSTSMSQWTQEFLVQANDSPPSFDMAAKPATVAPFTAFPLRCVTGVDTAAQPATSVDSGCDTSIGQRSRQEDTLILRNDVKTWGVFDGHRGHDASSFAANFFADHHDAPANGALSCKSDASDPSQHLADALNHMEASMHANGIGLACGTTACVAVVGADGMLRIANIGDSRAVLASRNGVVRLVTADHKVSSAQEVARFEREGFALRNGRLSDLSVTRGLGDFDIKAKNRGLSSAADIYEAHAEPGDVLIIATDGVWDVVSTPEAVRVVLEQVQHSMEPGATPRNGPRCAAQALVATALEQRSGDNCTVVVVSFKW